MDPQENIKQWALDQVGSPYVYGGTGGLCTPDRRRGCAEQYPQYAGKIKGSCPVLSGTQSSCLGCRYIGKACFDCAQLVRKALAQGGITLPSGASSQWRADVWAHRGPIGPEAERKMCVVFRESGDRDRPMAHVGLSLGDGRVIDARGHGEGVVIGPAGAYPWTHYALPAALYPGLNEPLKPGDRGDGVKRLQLMLMARGYPLPRFGADGEFGGETLDALRAFRRACGLAPGDSADNDLIARLEKALPLARDIGSRLDALEEAVKRLEEARA